MAQFQAPTDEELKMTADPKAPGAAAVYLNIEEIANDPLHYQSYLRAHQGADGEGQGTGDVGIALSERRLQDH